MSDLRPGDGVLAARGLGKVYRGAAGSVEVLKNLDLTVEAGTSLAVVGASGVGKTTLLHILGALDRATEGRIWFDGRDITGLTDNQLARFRNRQVGFVFQFHHLLPEFTALENAMMPGLVAGQAKSEARKRAEEILGRVGLENRLPHRVGELSGGEQQRVALARALVMSPRVLLADEPTGNLDADTGRLVGELIAELSRRDGLTTVVATHNLDLAAAMDRRVRVEQGRLVEEPAARGENR